MAKQTAAQKHTTAHLKRRQDRLDNRKMPAFQGPIFLSGVSVVSDADGNLYRVDCNLGTIRKLSWER